MYIYIYIHILGRMFTCLSCCGVLVNFMGISNMLNSVGMMKPATNDGFHKEPLCSVATRVGWSSPTWVAIQNGSAKFGKGLHTKVLGCSSNWGHLSRRNGGLSDKQGACVQSLWSYWPEKQPICISKQKHWDRSITQETGISLFKRFYDAFKHMNDRMTCCGTHPGASRNNLLEFGHSYGSHGTFDEFPI